MSDDCPLSDPCPPSDSCPVSDFFLLKTRPSDTRYILWSLLRNSPIAYESYDGFQSFIPQKYIDLAYEANSTGCSVNIDEFKWENRTNDSGILVKNPFTGEYREIKLIDLEFFVKEKISSDASRDAVRMLFDRFTTGNVTNERLREISPTHLLNVNPA